MLHSSDYAKNYASTIGKSLPTTGYWIVETSQNSILGEIPVGVAIYKYSQNFI